MLNNKSGGCSSGKQHDCTRNNCRFAFVHAIIFNAPLMRVKVELLAAAPFATAMAVTDFASATGAA